VRPPVLLTALAALSAALWLGAAARRVPFPFELTHGEDPTIIGVERVLRHQPIYTPPTLRYIPPPYPPVTFLLGATAARLFGFTPPALRLVSVTSTLVMAALVFMVVRRMGARLDAACCCAAIVFAAGTRVGDALDLARVDAPAALFALIGVIGAYGLADDARRRRRWMAIAVAGFAAAMLTKQPTVAIAAGAAAGLWRSDRAGDAVRMLAAAAAAAGIVFFWLDVRAGGAAWLALVSAPARPSIPWRDVASAVGRLFFYFPATLLVAAGWRRRGDRVWETAALAVVPMAIAANARVGGSDNVWLMYVPLLAIACGRYWTDHAPRISWRHPAAWLLAAQVAVLPHRPVARVPDAAERREHERLVAHLASSDAGSDDVLNLWFPYASMAAGRPPSGPRVQLFDFPPDDPLNRGLRAAIAAGALREVIATPDDMADWTRGADPPPYVPGVGAFDLNPRVLVFVRRGM